MMPLVFVVSVGEEAVTNGFSPTVPVPEMMLSVDPAARAKVPPRFSVALPTPPALPTVTRSALALPARLRLPKVTVEPVKPLRLMNSKAPPLSVIGTLLAIRLLIACTPVSSQRRSALFTVMAVVPDRRA